VLLGRRKGSSGYQSRHDVQWLVAGLGNPGSEYRGSPHNVGFEVVHLLAERHRAPLVAKHDGMYGVARIGEVDVALLMPLTYMNLSGRSVRPAMKALGLGVDRLLVVHDEIDLDFERLQLKVGGGLAGHNGLRSIADTVASREFVRLRMGVGRPAAGDRRPIRDWILQPFDPDRDPTTMYAHAADAVELLAGSGLRTATNRVNAAAG
jgi:PTH1 family peptidyl-tRNA hydrolase